MIGQGKTKFMTEKLQKHKGQSEEQKIVLSSALRKNLLRRKAVKSVKKEKEIKSDE